MKKRKKKKDKVRLFDFGNGIGKFKMSPEQRREMKRHTVYPDFPSDHPDTEPDEDASVESILEVIALGFAGVGALCAMLSKQDHDHHHRHHHHHHHHHR